MKFKNRSVAGQEFSFLLEHYRHKPNVIFLALLHGGVPVALEVAAYLQLPLYTYLAKRLSIPGYEKFTMSAIAGSEVIVFGDKASHILLITADQITQIIEQEQRDLSRYNQFYQQEKALPPMQGKDVIIFSTT